MCRHNAGSSLELDSFLCFSDSYFSVGVEKLEQRQRSFELDVSFHSASSNSIVTKNMKVTHVWITWCWHFDRLVKLSNDTQLMCSQVHYCTTSQTFLCLYQQETTGKAPRTLTECWLMCKNSISANEKRGLGIFFCPVQCTIELWMHLSVTSLKMNRSCVIRLISTSRCVMGGLSCYCGCTVEEEAFMLLVNKKQNKILPQWVRLINDHWPPKTVQIK